MNITRKHGTLIRKTHTKPNDTIRQLTVNACNINQGHK